MSKCIRGIDLPSVSTIFLLDFGSVPTVWYFLEVFRQCGIFLSVPTVWYFLEVFRQCGIFWKCFRQCGIFWNCSDSVVFFGTVPTVWYFWNCSDSVVFFGSVPTVWYFWNCSDSVLFFGTVPTVWYFLELFRQCGIFCFPFYIYASSHTILYMLVFMSAWSSWNHMFSKQHNS